jgi:hypothetical protein
VRKALIRRFAQPLLQAGEGKYSLALGCREANNCGNQSVFTSNVVNAVAFCIVDESDRVAPVIA